ncbi:hypothetical protein CYME_CMC033C [Cyanidioschyzon merolae strain 10D]|uniref:Uncharacterized protein n=1 Tax=Cyanidioschyzon merolae (strain NIES-3377 / 10D) TaxID=280699 RepID=M1VEN7_CYAM1|nr:hypothetical protein CYME_CMC033C [Cyanidioschyzon merolae strain 10D]BAM78978.1 hypothetical protein CYME_CMC033C [Cyanidioschyzon merolae strain 10D]|eukprot:XP_005535264.1 hypothetical protein CYME_CMC033C [Cyanidioschyzon merolae strain 10D]
MFVAVIRRRLRPKSASTKAFVDPLKRRKPGVFHLRTCEPLASDDSPDTAKRAEQGRSRTSSRTQRSRASADPEASRRGARAGGSSDDMRAGRGFGPQRQQDRTEQILDAFGLQRERAGRDLDQAAAVSKEEGERLAVRLFRGLRALFGGNYEALDSAEQWLQRLVLSMLALVLCAGIGVVFEASAASGRTALPAAVAAFLRERVEPAFTPLMLTFLGFSSLLGVYKAIQIEGDERTRYRE